MNYKILWLWWTCSLVWVVRGELKHDRTCINNLRLIEAAKDQVAIENNLATGAEIQPGVISLYIKNGLDSLKCPDQGFYTYGVVDDEPFCSLHGTMNGVMKTGRSLTTLNVSGHEAFKEREKTLDALLESMSREKEAFDPSEIVELGPEGVLLMTERFLPQVTSTEGTLLTKKEFIGLMEDLSHGSYQERVTAIEKLTIGAQLFRLDLEKAAQGKDPEVKKQVRILLEKWDERNLKFARFDYGQYEQAITVAMKDPEAGKLLTVLKQRAEAVQPSGAVNQTQKNLIEACLNVRN